MTVHLHLQVAGRIAKLAERANHLPSGPGSSETLRASAASTDSSSTNHYEAEDGLHEGRPHSKLPSQAAGSEDVKQLALDLLGLHAAVADLHGAPCFEVFSSLMHSRL